MTKKRCKSNRKKNITTRSYRKDYSIYVGYEIPSDYHVHHIDHDRANNKIANLVAIRQSDHSEYHTLHGSLNASVYYYESMVSNGVRPDATIADRNRILKPYQDNILSIKSKLSELVSRITVMKKVQDAQAVNNCFA